MKLSQLYSNDPKHFPPILFNGIEDKDLSVIYARVKKPKDAQKDSHNLGKTLLVELIDFLLLKNVNDAAAHFLSKHFILFADWVFFLEIQTPAGTFITVRRGVKEPSKVAFRTHPQRIKPQANNTYAHTDWDHKDLAIDRAVQLLDGHLGLDAIKPFSYRSGVGYFLRTQADYHDLFQLAKTSQSPDKFWKPYMAKLFGLDPDLVTRKYELDDEVAELRKKADEIQQTVPSVKTRNLNELRMDVNNRRTELAETEGRLDRFKFAQEELRISKEAAEELENEDAEINDRLANLDYDIGQIKSSMTSAVMFDLAHIQKVFKETETYFSPQLAKDYEELLHFNRTITTERSKFLKQQLRELEKERNELATRKGELDETRSRYYEILRERDTFKKFKSLQKEQAVQRAELESRILQIRQLQALQIAEQNFRTKQVERTLLIEQIDAQVSASTPIHERISSEFARMVRRVLALTGNVFLEINKSGNIECRHTADPPKTDAGQSSQSEGTTYKRLLCILFDLAVLKAYSDQAFFRFVYHDGVLETMDDRKKFALLKLLKEFATETGVQYIFSVIESEMPIQENGLRLEFTGDEIVRELSDVGTKGRLFQMSPF